MTTSPARRAGHPMVPAESVVDMPWPALSQTFGLWVHVVRKRRRAGKLICMVVELVIGKRFAEGRIVIGKWYPGCHRFEQYLMSLKPPLRRLGFEKPFPCLISN